MGNSSPSNIQGIGVIPKPDTKLIMQNNVNGNHSLLMNDLPIPIAYIPMMSCNRTDTDMQISNSNRLPISLMVKMLRKAPKIVLMPIITWNWISKTIKEMSMLCRCEEKKNVFYQG